MGDSISDQSIGPDGSAGAVLAERVRRAILTLMVATAGFALGEVLFRLGEKPMVTMAHLLCLIALGSLLALASRSPDRRTLLACGVLALFLSGVTSAGIAIATSSATTSSFVFVALSMGAAALVPWGPKPQLVAVTLLGLIYPGAVFLAEGNISVLRSRELMGLLVVFAASVYIAREMDRSRRLIAREQRERRRHEVELDQQRTFLRQVIDINPHLIFAKDRDGRFTLVNQATADVYGATVEAIIGKTDGEFNPHGDEVENFRRDDLDVIDGLREKIIAEEVITDSKGNRRWVRTIKRPLASSGGRVEQVLGVATDITEQRRSQEQLREEACLAAALARVGERIIGSLNRPDLLDRLCQVAAEALDCSWAQMWLWQEVDDVLAPAGHFGDAREAWEAVSVLRLPRAVIADLWAQAEQAEVLALSLEEIGSFVPASALSINSDLQAFMAVPLRRAGAMVGAVVVGSRRQQEPFTQLHHRIARGIAQVASLAFENARLLDQLERANRLKSEFMATMSHELRTPLNVIIGYNALMLDGAMGPTTGEQDDTMRRIRGNAVQLLDMINATLDVSRLETGHVPLDIRPVHLAEVLAETALQTRDLQEKAGVELSWHVPADVPVVETDSVKLKVVLKNLVSNALKFTSQGSVRTSVTSGHEQVEIAVSDTGIGIPFEAQAAIFDAFRQADSSIGPRFGGVGLGLYIVRRLVDTLGGTVSVESEPGHGSTFRIRLPREFGSIGSANLALLRTPRPDQRSIA